MNIKFLKAGGGDSILINHKNKNILIDGGNDTSYLKRELISIKNNDEFLDLLIITHHDDDHILGIIEILKQVKEGVFGEKLDFIKQVIFNSPSLIQKKMILEQDQLLSYKNAHITENLLLSIGAKWDKVITNESLPLFFDDMKLSFLSPIKKDLQDYLTEDSGVLLSGQSRCDWNESMTKLEKYLDNDSQDNSLSNRSSIVILLEDGEKKILLTGDVTPDRFTAIINDLSSKNDNKPVEFNYIKLPHHGSYRNLNKEILLKIDCLNFVITTNGKNSYLPNKKALLKIIRYLKNEKKDRINFIFNYKETIDALNIDNSDKKKYNISLLPNNNDYGFSI